jgi:NADH-quinone oxidoreductase subunit J
MNGPLIAFYALSAVILVSAVLIVTTRRIMHAVLLHLLALSCVGGYYILLYAEFIAILQVLIYAGAVTTMVLFTLMLTKGRSRGGERALDHLDTRPALIAAGAFLVTLLVTLAPKVWSVSAADPGRKDVAAFGRILFTRYALPFELVSILLLAALVGAIVLAGKEE